MKFSRSKSPAIVDRGTPETREHQKRRGPGTIEALLNKGRIGGYELRAAEEIMSVYTYTTSSLTPKVMRYEPRGDKGYSDNDPFWYRDAYVSRYRSWANRNRDQFTLVVAIIIDGYGLRWLDCMCGKANGSMTFHFIDALRGYALAAGWVDANTADDWRREQARAA